MRVFKTVHAILLTFNVGELKFSYYVRVFFKHKKTDEVFIMGENVNYLLLKCVDTFCETIYYKHTQLLTRINATD